MWMYYLNNIDFCELLLFMRWKMFYFVKNIFANEPFFIPKKGKMGTKMLLKFSKIHLNISAR